MLSYRFADLDDIRQLRELEQGIIDAERPFDSFIKTQATTYYDLECLLSSAQSCVMVAEDEGRIIGTGYARLRDSKTAHKHDQHVYLGFMFVVPEYRGNGVNRRIMERLIGWSKDRGIEDIYLEVYSQNKGAIRAYEKAGFVPITMEMKLNNA